MCDSAYTCTFATSEHVLFPLGREEAPPKVTPRLPRWRGEFPWSTHGVKPILDLTGGPLYAEFLKRWATVPKRDPYRRLNSPLGGAVKVIALLDGTFDLLAMPSA